MRAITSLTGSTLSARDGTIGTVNDSYFDDHAWTIRYLVVETGGWLSSRKVLISPHSVMPPLSDDGMINVALTREKVRESPKIDTHQPVSRRQESDFLSYYGIPYYWSGAGPSTMGAYAGAYTMIPPPSPSPEESEYVRRESEVIREDVHLRSADSVNGYHLQANDDSIGHIEDFIFEEESWTIRYLVVDTSNWWPAGKKVLVATHWIDKISWAEQKVFTTLSRESVMAGPVYEDAALIDRDYETRLHLKHRREGYWERIATELPR